MQPGKEGGTWLTMNKYGKIGVLLNIGQGRDINAIDQESTRGFYAVEWVTKSDKKMGDLFEHIKERHGNRPSLFRLVALDVK